jgi:DNA replication and repair protein RecF
LAVEKDDGQQMTCEYGIDRRGTRRFRIDGQPINRRQDLVGHLNAVFFAPNSVRLVRGAPVNRRRFLDQGLATIDPLYLTHITSYQRALRHTARLLLEIKRGVRTPEEAKEELKAWNQKLAEHALEVCGGRHQYTARIAGPATTNYNQIAGGQQILEVVYRPKLKVITERMAQANKTDLSLDELEREIRDEFDYIRQDEIRRGRPLTGPQLDDCEVRLAKRDLRTFGSQGETRTAAVSLLLAQRDVVYEQRSVRPVLFFDDIFSELDRNRSRQLQEITVRDHQVFIATACEDDVSGWRPKGLRKWLVTEGKIGEIDA